MPLEGAALLNKDRPDSSAAQTPPSVAGNPRAYRPGEIVQRQNAGIQPPPHIPGYAIERQIGRGSSATVYLASEQKHNRQVALKVLHPALTASLQAARFLQEIHIIARLTHPNVLPLLDSGRVGDLLYYSTPFVAGESLRVRLERDGPLTPGDAVRLAREVAAALDYAHRQGVVHRDVKPENILLADGHVYVADFGIARAVSVSTDQRLTSGLPPGTPLYMSPEQIDGSVDADAKSDIYSLACMVYELVAGQPPFTGESAQFVIAQHLSAPIPSLRSVVPHSPRALDRALTVAMAKKPCDRFSTAAAFADALVVDGWLKNLTGHVVRDRSRTTIVAALMTLLAVGLLATVRSGIGSDAVKSVRTRLGLDDILPDTTLYIVIPLDSTSESQAGADVVGVLRSELGRWRNIFVKREPRTEEVNQRAGLRGLAGETILARELGAGRFVHLDVAGRGESLDIAATLYGTESHERLKTVVVRSATDSTSTRLAMRTLADSLLLRDSGARGRKSEVLGTTSLFAQQAYLRGHRALANGDFALAETQFSLALNYDHGFTPALIWLANVRNWSSPDTRLWDQFIAQSDVQKRVLSQTDSLALAALSALVVSDMARACALWRRLTRVSPDDYAAWYSLGTCLRRDEAVLPLKSAPHWQFRTSTEESVRAYERAFRLQPSVLRAFRGNGLGALQDLLYTSGARVRMGRTLPPQVKQFYGYPVWQRDSVAIVPLPIDDSRLAPLPDAVGEAIQHQRLRFRSIAAMWNSRSPGPDAAEAMAVALEILGDVAALDTLRRARASATDASDQLRIAIREVWLRVKFHVPGNPDSLRAARDLADSIVLGNLGAPGDEMLSSVAVLIGRAAIAATYARRSLGDDRVPTLNRDGPALIAFASLGGPQDSLRQLERIVQGDIQSSPLSSRDLGRRDWLTRSATLAFPNYRFESLPARGETGLRLGNLVAASLADDTVRVRRFLSSISAARRSLRPADVMPDGLLPEASALDRIGDRAAAIGRLDPTLTTIRFIAGQDLAFSYRAGPLVRAMVLRADLAQQMGDKERARVWAKAVVALWSGADPFLQPTVQRMRRLAQ